jgi:S-adenosylmethionine synthetase
MSSTSRAPRFARSAKRDAALGFSAEACAVINAIDKQSPDIAQGLNGALEACTTGSAGGSLDVAGAALRG